MLSLADVSYILPDLPFKPFEHQIKAVSKGAGRKAFAYLMEQGTGKTFTVIIDAVFNYDLHKISAVLVFCPNSVKSNWVEEIERLLPKRLRANALSWRTSDSKAYKQEIEDFFARVGRPGVLSFLIFNREALINRRAMELVHRLLEKASVFATIDESTSIAQPGATRTKVALKIGEHPSVKIKRIMTGTPVIKRPEKAYAQFRFLDPKIFGFTSFYSFRHHFCKMGGFGGKEIKGYQNLEELGRKIENNSYRVLKSECLDLPSKVYQRIAVEMTPQQRRKYDEMREEMIVRLAEYGQEDLEAQIVMTQMLRLQQIAGGFLPKTEGEGMVPLCSIEENPKIQAAMDIIEGCDCKVIVWSRFTAEIFGMIHALEKAGVGYLRFDGQVNEAGRKEVRRLFNLDNEFRVLVGNPAAGGVGLNLQAAGAAIYLSNSFSTEERVQSEDRCHRIGSERHKSITYYDIVAKGTVDLRVLSVMRQNKRLSDEILKDGWKEWI